MSARPARHRALVGMLTIAVAAIAVLLAYNANSGVPLVPGRTLRVEVPDAANLVVGNDVRMAGVRVGSVRAIDPVRRDDGSVGALLRLRLDGDLAPLPVDTTVLVRPRAPLGLKYVELSRGRAARHLVSGARLPVAAARPRPVELDEMLGTFDARTRRASQIDLRAFGDLLAGRGAALNATFAQLEPLTRVLEPTMANLARPSTHLEPLIGALARTAREVAPVAAQQAGLVRGLDTTFTALAQVAPRLERAIAEGPALIESGIRSLPLQRPFLEDAAALLGELRPGARSLRGAAGELAAAFAAGSRTLRRSPALSRRLEPTLTDVRRFAEDPRTIRGIRRLRTGVRSARPTLAALAPTQATCNYVTLLLRNAASLLSDGDANGTWQRFTIIGTPQGPDNEGGPSARPAAGPAADNFLHANPYPNTAAPGQPKECEAGNERYAAGRQAIGNAPGRQRAATEATTAETSP